MNLVITPNLFAPINHACPYCGAQPAEDCSRYALEPTAFEWPIYHAARIDAAIEAGNAQHILEKQSGQKTA